jgi:hypothetical protein
MLQLKAVVLTAILGLSPSSSLAACTRDGLLSAASSYLAAQTVGKPSLLTLASNFTYQQNNKASDTSKSLLTTPYAIALNRSTADTIACASYTMWISTSGPKPFVVSTQLRHANNDTSAISMIDTVAATTDDLFFDAKNAGVYSERRLDRNSGGQEAGQGLVEEGWRCVFGYVDG